MTLLSWYQWYSGYFSTHILTWRITICIHWTSWTIYFSTHILTWRMTEQRCQYLILLIFQLTSSHGGWPDCDITGTSFQFFNSHPHKEDDGMSCTRYKMGSYFSTHILTRRMTCMATSRSPGKIFSTHILTRRMTKRAHPIKLIRLFSTHILTRRMTRPTGSYPASWNFSTHILTRRMT